MAVIAPQSTITRPANTTAYTAADLVANDTTAGNVTPFEWSLQGLGRGGILRRVRITKSATSATNANFNLHLFDASPTVANGDNGALSVSTNADTFLGTVALDATSGGLAGASSSLTDVSGALEIPLYKPTTGGKVYGLLAAAAGYTPASGETFKIVLEIEG